jgi:hypothetical protein
MATLLPNQARLLTLARMPARWADQFFAKAVLVADIEGNMVACQQQRSLIGTATAKARQWHVHVLVNPANQAGQRNEFTKRHQMILGVEGSAGSVSTTTAFR